jgi:prepilin-type N-terminal cleavage/methylation domain-containing protein
MRARRRDGFTLIECLIGMALSLYIISAGLEFFGLTQKAFARLKEREETIQAALAAIDRMRIDLLHAGRGLVVELGLGLVEAVRATGTELRTVELGKALRPAADANAGDVRVPFVSTADIAAGREISFCDGDGRAGEVRTVVRVEKGAVVLDNPLVRGYAAAAAFVSLLESVTYFLDAPAHILRRRINAGSAQPLLENAAAATWLHDADAHLVRIRLELDVEGVQPHEATVFLKNPALAR